MNRCHLKSVKSNLISLIECCDCLEASAYLLYEFEENAITRMIFNEIRFTRDLADAIHNILSYIPEDGEN